MLSGNLPDWRIKKQIFFERWILQCTTRCDLSNLSFIFVSSFLPLSHFPGIKIDVMPFHFGDLS